MLELSATSRCLPLGRKTVALPLRVALEHVYTPYLAARALGMLEVWLLGYRVLLAAKHFQLVAALSCVQLGGVIVSFKMYWKIAFVSYLFHFSGLMVLKDQCQNSDDSPDCWNPPANVCRILDRSIVQMDPGISTANGQSSVKIDDGIFEGVKRGLADDKDEVSEDVTQSFKKMDQDILAKVCQSPTQIKDRTVAADTQTSPIKDGVTAVLKSFDQIHHGTADFTQSSAPMHDAAPNSVDDKIHEHVTQSFANIKAEVRNQISQSFARMKNEIVRELTHELAQNISQMMKKTGFVLVTQSLIQMVYDVIADIFLGIAILIQDIFGMIYNSIAAVFRATALLTQGLIQIMYFGIDGVFRGIALLTQSLTSMIYGGITGVFHGANQVYSGNIWDIRNGPHVMIIFVMLVVAWAVNKVIAKTFRNRPVKQNKKGRYFCDPTNKQTKKRKGKKGKKGKR